EAASVVSAHGPVRAALLDMQQRFARKPPGAVLDGRDIGTVVCPDAAVKLFVTATAEERARRRARELRAAGLAVDEGAILDDIRRRDLRDMSRPVAPLRPADDAVLLDTTNLDIDAAFRAAIDLIGRARSESGVRRGL
ncbi:MAG TPA: (d)CMP kinase, partial [Gaiellaceae bacterium]|nr:(d)CMP kinase [Gaiellaceae bacterium]